MGKEGQHLGVTRIGVIADTHGLLRPEVLEVFDGVDHILHAGDIGGEDVIDALREIAPVTFVVGNNDEWSAAACRRHGLRRLAVAGSAAAMHSGDGYDVVRADIAGCRILLTHVLPRPQEPGKHVVASLRDEPADVIVFGHSHLPHDERVHGVWYFNPASAGPRRFDYPVSVGIFEHAKGVWRGQHVALDERSTGALEARMNQLSR